MLDNKRIRVTDRRRMDEALVATGFPVRDPSRMETFMPTFEQLLLQVRGIRRAGAASLDLAYVASGRLDGYWEFGLQPWDIAAGALLVQEAGGLAGEIYGREDVLDTGHVLAATPRLYKQLQAVLTQRHPENPGQS